MDGFPRRIWSRFPNALGAAVLLLSIGNSLAGSYAMLFYKNNYSTAVDCWVNGQYQGVIPAHSTKYMPVEGFVTSDSRWLPDGTLYQKYAYGGWSPSSPAEVVTVALSGIGEPLVYWTGAFTATDTGLYLKVHNGEEEIDALDVEFAEGMPKGDPKDLAVRLGDKKFSPRSDLDGAASDGQTMAAFEESNIVFTDSQTVQPPYTIGIRRVSDEVYLVQLLDDGKEVERRLFDDENDSLETFVDSYVPNGKVSVIVTWLNDRPSGSPPELSNIWITVNGEEYAYDQSTGLDWNGGAYGEAIRLNLKPPEN